MQEQQFTLKQTNQRNQDLSLQVFFVRACHYYPSAIEQDWQRYLKLCNTLNI